MPPPLPTPDFEARTRASFARQSAMSTLGITIEQVAPGRVELALRHRDDLTQQHGFLHAGIVSTALDSACGYAGFTLMPAGAGVLTIEFKVNLLAPARGQRFRMVGQVVKPGRTITVTEGRAYAIDGGHEKLIATLGATLMTITGRDDVKN